MTQSLMPYLIISFIDEQQPADELTPIMQPGGELYQHDMMLADFQRDIAEGRARGRKNVVYRWPNNTVPYQLIGWYNCVFQKVFILH